MKKLIAGGLGAALVAGGLGLASGAHAENRSTSTTSLSADKLAPSLLGLNGLLGLDDLLDGIGDILGDLPIAGPLVTQLLDALEGLLGGDDDLAVGDLVDSLTSILGSTDSGDLPEVVTGLTSQLTEALNPAQLTAVIAGLTGEAGVDGVPTLVGDLLQSVEELLGSLLGGGTLDASLVKDLLAALTSGNLGGLDDLLGEVGALDGVLDTVADLVNSLLGIAGGGIDADLLQSILNALSIGDLSLLEDLLTQLIGGLPEGSNDLSIVTHLLEGLLSLIGDVTTTILPPDTVTTIINNVITRTNPPAPSKPTGPVVQSPAPSITSLPKYVVKVNPKITGAGVPGASLSVTTSTGKFLGRTVVTPSGSWSLVSNKLKVGAYSITARQAAQGKSASKPSAAVKFRVVSKSAVISTKAGTKFKTKRPTIKGTGYPGAKITLKTKAGKKLGSTKVKADGTWKIKSKKLKKGTRTIKATQSGHGKTKTTKVKKIKVS